MNAKLLHVVTAISNPLRWDSRLDLYHAFRRHILDAGCPLTVVECAYGDIPHQLADDAHINHVPVSSRSEVWIKENLQNIGVSRLPRDWQYVLFLDADVMFRSQDWAEELVYLLNRFPVVHPWSQCLDIGGNGEILKLAHSFGHLWNLDRENCHKGKSNDEVPGTPPDPYKYAHPGYGMAFTRAALEGLGGLLEVGVLGAGDHHMVMALSGRPEWSLPGWIHQDYKDAVTEWAERARKVVNGNIGFLDAVIEHGFHGDKSGVNGRQYVPRWKILEDNDYNPRTDIRKNLWGVIELAGNKPALAHGIRRYFANRDEDIHRGRRV